MALLPDAAWESMADARERSSRDKRNRADGAETDEVREGCRDDIRQRNAGCVPRHAPDDHCVDADVPAPTRARRHRYQPPPYEQRLVRRLDVLLLPILCLLFLINSLDRSNIGNAETAHFTRDAGIDEADLNLAVAVMYGAFVALQPVGAALGRKVGMSVWVPLTMGAWGACTVAHVWVKGRWGLVALRGIIGCLEAGFYPTTVSYISLFYTRYEFGRRLALFYGSAGVAGALGGVLAFAIFSRYDLGEDAAPTAGWKPWQYLFMIEGAATIVVAAVAFFWLPRSAGTAWFLTQEEADWAEERVKIDREYPRADAALHDPTDDGSCIDDSDMPEEERRLLASDWTRDGSLDRAAPAPAPDDDGGSIVGESHDGQQADERAPAFQPHLPSDLTRDSGLGREDILSTVLFFPLIIPILILNILSAIPATAFSVFLPLVVSSMHISSPVYSNLLTAPPFLIATAALFIFSSWSDRTRQRIVPLLYSLGVTLAGLVLVMGFALLPESPARGILLYISLCVLLSGSYVPSPLATSWLAGNIPLPGKRAIILGINGYGNLAGVVSSVLFAPAHQATVYRLPFLVTALCTLAALAGYRLLRSYLLRVNISRAKLAAWYTLECEENRSAGSVEVWTKTIRHAPRWAVVGGVRWDQYVRHWVGHSLLGMSIEDCYVRRGDESVAYEYEL